MRIFKNKWFSRFARKEGITDDMLRDAIAAADSGKVDADYGSGLIKQRIGRYGSGKSGGFRTIIAYRKGDLALFLYGFAKKDKDNLSEDELREYRKAAGHIGSLNGEAICALVRTGAWVEIRNEQEDVQK